MSEAKKKKAQYDVQYMKDHVERKFIPFNKGNPDDLRMLEWLKGKKNVTRYVKDLIQADMDKAGE